MTRYEQVRQGGTKDLMLKHQHGRWVEHADAQRTLTQLAAALQKGRT